MTNTQYIADTHKIVCKTDKNVSALLASQGTTLALLKTLARVSEGAPPKVAKPEPKATAKPKARAKAAPKAQAKPEAVVSVEQRNRWYALEGGLRESVGMASKRNKDGRVRVSFFAKKGKTASPAQLAKAVALVTK